MKTLRQFAKAYGLEFQHDWDNGDYYVKGTYQGYSIDIMLCKYTDNGGGYSGTVEVRKESNKKHGNFKRLEVTTQASAITQVIALLTDLIESEKEETTQDEPKKPYMLEKIKQANELLETGGLSFDDREKVLKDKEKAQRVGKAFIRFFYRIRDSFGKDHDRQVRESANYFIIGYLQSLVDNDLITYNDKIALGKLYQIGGIKQ